MSAFRMRCLALAPAFAAIVCLEPANAQIATPAEARIDVESLMETVRTLSSPAFEGRRTGTPGNEKARAWISERFRGTGLAAASSSVEIPFKFTRKTETHDGVNIAVVCPGRGAADNGAMIVTAHYDHVGVRDGALHPGADDNASGVAVLLELARHCRRSPWTHDAIFVALDAEELGLQGARALVSS
ncbi:MAG: M28 family peptidase, partial [Vicinamibacterales bacterium]